MTKRTNTPAAAPALAGLTPDTLIALDGNVPAMAIESLANAAAESNFGLLSDQNLHVSGWRVQLVGIGPVVQITLNTGQRVRCGSATMLARDVCRADGSLIWWPCTELSEGMEVLAIRRHEPQYWEVGTRAHYAASRLRVQHVCALPPSPLYSATSSDFALAHESGAALVVGGLGLKPHRCPRGCVPTLPAFTWGRAGAPVLRPLTDEERQMYVDPPPPRAA